MRKFYIADTHFGHERVIAMNNRPFSDAAEMDLFMINQWNSVVNEEDDVYIIGDFIYHSKNLPEYYLNRLKGKKHLIIGNHERWLNKIEPNKFFESVNNYLEINDQGHQIILFHYPIAEWAYYYRNSLHIFGHIHNNRTGPAYTLIQNQPNMLNAGVDINNFTPVTLTELQNNNDTFKKS